MTTVADRLLERSSTIFEAKGFNAVGIDLLLAEAGVAKMSLYKHFKSKEGLVLAALRRRDQRFRATFTALVEARASEPRARLLAVFDVLARWFEREDFRGCIFLNAAAEFPEAGSPIRLAVAEHKAWLRQYLASLARAANAPDPPTLAGELAVLVDGAIARANAAREADAASTARRAAEAVVRAAFAGEIAA
ncbi:MAG: TetR/AcrR family transcriptional regulator [Phycisphaerales bacterium]|nr:TetR/AcrR family transcriptional regulator [Phycisphaerales bacterium]